MGSNMAHAPGFVTDLGDRGQRGWSQYLQELLNGGPRGRGALARAAEANEGVAASVLLDGDAALRPGVEPIDWSAYPVRVVQSLNRSAREINAFMDWSGSHGHLGRGYCHEEYLEWRVVRRGERLLRIEMTTETPDYWATLARYEPQKVVELAARFAGEPVDQVNVRDLFGIDNPFSVDPFSEAGAQLARSYRGRNDVRRNERTLPPLSAYNNGTKAILHMANPVNSTAAALDLAVFAAYPHATREGAAERALSGPEAITDTAQQAVNCRNSDPTIVGVVIGKVFAGHKLALMDPIGIYITSFDHTRLLHAGNPIPHEWVSLQRGTSAAANPARQDLFQRLVLQVPPSLGIDLSDLTDEFGDSLSTGGQVARLVTVGLYARTTAQGAVTAPRNVVVLTPQPPRCDTTQEDAREFREVFEEFRREQTARVDVDLPGGRRPR